MPLALEQLMTRAVFNSEEGPLISHSTPTSTISTASAVTYTAAQVAGGRINRDPGADRTDVLPTAALLIAYLRNLVSQKQGVLSVGMTLDFILANLADAAETITLSAGSGGTSTGQTMTIAQNNSKRFQIRLTNVTPGSEAYVVYNLGTFTT